MEHKSRRYCSVPQCKSYPTTEVSLHKFPDNTNIARKWKIALRIDKPISKYMLVCSLHFNKEDYHIQTPYKRRRILKPNCVPSRNIPQRLHDRFKNVHTKREERYKKRQNCVNKLRMSIAAGSSQCSNETPEIVNEADTTGSEQPLNFLAAICSQQDKLPVTRNQQVQVNMPSMILPDNPIDKILTCNKLVIAYTGIDIELFNCIDKLLSDDNIKIVNSSNKLLLTLTKIKLNLSFRVLSGLFQRNESNLKRYFEETIPLLKTVLKSAVYWPSLGENRKSMPTCFSKYSKTRAIFDCTEIAVQVPNCLRCKIRLYSYYKSRHTIKFLIGVNPAGLIIYISPAYGGRASDKAIFNNENVISLFEPYIDHIMVDKGFAIEQECLEFGIRLIRPPFKRKSSQLSKEQAQATANIARARVHVERAIQRFKVFKLCSERIQWSLLPYIDDVAVIVSALVNLSSPILKDDKF